MAAPHKMRRVRMLGFVLSMSIAVLKIYAYLSQDADDRRVFFNANSRIPHQFSRLPLDLGIVKPAPISQMKEGNRPSGRRIPAIGKTRLRAESSQIAATISPSHTSQRGMSFANAEGTDTPARRSPSVTTCPGPPVANPSS